MFLDHLFIPFFSIKNLKLISQLCTLLISSLQFLINCDTPLTYVFFAFSLAEFVLLDCLFQLIDCCDCPGNRCKLSL